VLAVKQPMDSVIDWAPMTPHRITPRQPAIGARFMLWHPAYGWLTAYRDRGGFYEAHHGTIAYIVGPLTWWCECPERPPGEEEPSREAWLNALERANRSTQIGTIP